CHIGLRCYFPVHSALKAESECMPSLIPTDVLDRGERISDFVVYGFLRNCSEAGDRYGRIGKACKVLAEWRSVIAKPGFRYQRRGQGLREGSDDICGSRIFFMNIEERILGIVKYTVIHVVAEECAQAVIEIVIYPGRTGIFTKTLPTDARKKICGRV